MVDPTKWNWYGTWVLDYLLCEKEHLADEAWEAFGIWEKAYLAANPDLVEAREESYRNLWLGRGECDAPGTSLDLISNHYDKAMEPVFKSWVFAIWCFLQWPMATIRHLVWTIKRKFL